MDVDKTKLICGIKPTRLKHLLRRDDFDTPTAMKDLDQREPEATRTLLALESEGWISYSSTHEGIDHWSIDQKGMRLVATHLLKRISGASVGDIDLVVELGRRVLDRTSGALKNAIDYLFAEWNNKAAGFIGYRRRERHARNRAPAAFRPAIRTFSLSARCSIS